MVADIEVILWLPKVPNVGHLSLELSDGFYISFWPENQSRWKKTCRGNTYQDDLRAEGRQPDEILYLPPRIVDQDEIKRWWRRVMDNKEYNLVLNNCSSVVREALRKGGIYEDPVLKGVDTVSRPIDTPSAVFSWAGVCKDLYHGNRGKALVRQLFEPASNNVRSLWNWVPGLD